MAGHTFTFRGQKYPQLTPGLEFDAEAHEYKWKGRPVPSVSALLRPYRDFSAIPPDNLAAAMHFGTMLHEALYLLDIGDLDMDSLDPMLLPYVRGYERYRDEQGFSTGDMLAEVSLYHDRCGYAGTLDRLFASGNHDVLIDFKSGQSNKFTGVQLAGYAKLLLAMGVTRLDRLRLIEITFGADGTVVQRPCKYAPHLNVFNCLQTAYNYFLA